MITIERTDYAFAAVDASIEEWAAIKAIVRYCANHYWATELHYLIPGPEERRPQKVESLSEAMEHVWGEPPVELVFRDEVLLLTQCVTDTEGKGLPGVDEDFHADLAGQIYTLDVYGIFDDDKVTDETWDRWARERRVHDTVSWIIKLHAGQTDKAGHAYAQHPLRVHMRLQSLFPDAGEDVRHAALLHDVMEDCGITADDLHQRGYSDDTIDMVSALTKNPDDGRTYAQRIEWLAEQGTVGAMQVKLCDLLDNTDPERLRELPDAQAASLSQRYAKAIALLTSRLEALGVIHTGSK
jgi:hypothetical protein